MNKKTSATNFSKIDSPQDLISYLSNSKKRLTKQKSMVLNMYITIQSYPMSYQ